MILKKPLFTVGILSYSNYEYIYEALDSVLVQDYENIELMVFNDASPDFQAECVAEYIETHKKENIQAVQIYNQPENVGTVKNINQLRSRAQGEIIMYLAADDALYSKDVVSRFVEKFEQLGEDAYVVSGLTAMCGHQLDEIITYAPDADGVQAIKNDTPQQLFSRISHTFTIPTTSTAYRMSLYNKIGGFDEDYYIIEDAVIYAKMCRLGIQVYWIDQLIAARHRDGGISHGNTANLSEAYRKYRLDEIRLYDREVWPNKTLLSPVDFKKFKAKYKYVTRHYFEEYVYPNMTLQEKIRCKIKHIPVILLHILQRGLAQLLALALSKDLFQTILLTAGMSFGLVFLCMIGMPIPIMAGTVSVLVQIGKISAIGSLAMLMVRLMVVFVKALRFIILGK